ncbi:L-2-hydroxyglutarate dehydrogenase, mitochondrial [Agrilus planipennis]|uniref:L-2-hydroxyglutarate dehydrogenase, mitochondrial n=1 Tax=Agrilus planipennis TaxID=224129 RepID=A0A1W4WTY9_AGRPL|nr:L-2-hydroxyglutarate dehydrogenase, mitochondrial [Agrilus planipennis]
MTYNAIMNRRKCSAEVYKIFKTFFSSTSNKVSNYDFVVVGGGIVGVAAARQILLKNPKLKIAVLEKENKLAQHQTGHNSGVIHAGIYYKPGSLKAKLCVEGLHLSYKYCEENKIPFKKVGKLIVATNNIEVERLLDLQDRGLKNNVPGLELLEKDRIKEVEPSCEGVKALWSPETGIVDWALVTEFYGKDVMKMNGDIILKFKVNGFKENNDPNYPVLITSADNRQVATKYALTCAGLYSDHVAKMSGCSPDPMICPFRGEYLLLTKSKANLVKGNIYPVPDPKFPFLGVHFTPRMNGDMWLGPNAVLAFKREGYKVTDINLKELFEVLLYPGFQKLAFKYISFGILEMKKSLITSFQVRDLQKFIPSLTTADVQPGPAGVRAQALDRNGNLVDDFVFDKGGSEIGARILHCRNAPSPGATSSLAIAKMLEERVEKEFNISMMHA